MATTSTLPRPSRSSFGPPSGPLPSLPPSRSRKASQPSTTIAMPTSTSALPTTRMTSLPTTASALPQLPLPPPPPVPPRKSTPTTGIPTASAPISGRSSTPNGQRTASGENPSTTYKIVRKTVSIGSFPQPPSVAKISGNTYSPSPLASSMPLDMPSNGFSPVKQRHSVGGRAVPPRASSVANPRISVRSSSLKASSSVLPSLLDGGANRMSISVPSPDSRTSSALGSIEDDEDNRERDTTPVNGASDKKMSVKSGKDKGNVIVSVRVRPDASDDDADSKKSDVEWCVESKRSLISYRGREGGEYYFDNVFAWNDNNPKVYDAAAKRLVRRVMEGYHGTVFAYGMTGTGKTFSMQGTATNPGVIPLAITDIFSFIRETPHREFLLRVSYLEIYNEKIHDLLAVGGQAGVHGQQQVAQEEIKLREDSKRGVYATPLKEEIVQSPTQLLRVIARGDNARRTGSTQWNARSSRSHAVVQIVVESRERGGAAGGGDAPSSNKRAALLPGGVRVSTLSLIDLAGSEKAASDKERRTEGAHINKSLLTLGTVIANLSGDKYKDKNKAGAGKDGKHLPYRDSKLTRLLQPALQGNSLVSILCTIQIGSAGSCATAQNHTGETLGTLKFASRAKNNIVSHAKRAEEAVGGTGAAAALLDRYRLDIVDLRRQLQEVKPSNSSERRKSGQDGDADEEGERRGKEGNRVVDVEGERKRVEARELEHEQRHEEQMLEMQLARTALKERIEHLNKLILSSKSIGVNTNRCFSSLSMGNMRQSAASNYSLRSSAAIQDAAGRPPTRLARKASAGSVCSVRETGMGMGMGMGGGADNASDETNNFDDESADGNASLPLQVRALQANLADKNRYISTLESRLLQARRSSSSRLSMGLMQQADAAALLAEKDAEIAELRARLDDKDRMVAALRSATRKRDLADLSLDTCLGADVASRRSSGRSPRELTPSTAVAAAGPGETTSAAPAADRASLVGPGGRGLKGVDGVTRLLDDLIRDKAASQRGHSNASPTGLGCEQAIFEVEEDAEAGAVNEAAEGARIDSGIGGLRLERMRSGSGGRVVSV